MPLDFYQELNSKQKLAVWNITEPLSYFQDHISISFEIKNPNRLLERVVALFLLDYLTQKNIHLSLDYDEFGKPFIKNSDLSVSFSHSKNYIACFVDETKNDLGIDIECYRDNISMIASKFVNHEDSTPFEDDVKLKNQYIWGAKEVLFKIWGKKNVDFKKDLLVLSGPKNIGIIKKYDESHFFNLDFYVAKNYFLIWSCF